METPAACPSLWPHYQQLHPQDNSSCKPETACCVGAMYNPLYTTAVLPTSTAVGPFHAAPCTTSLYMQTKAALLDPMDLAATCSASGASAEGCRWFSIGHDATVSSGSSSSSICCLYDSAVGNALRQGSDFRGNFRGQSIELQQSLPVHGITVYGSSPEFLAASMGPGQTLATVGVDKHLMLPAVCNIIGVAAETVSTSGPVRQGLHVSTPAVQQQLMLLVQQQQMLKQQEHLVQQVQHKHETQDVAAPSMALKAAARAVPDVNILSAVVPTPHGVDISRTAPVSGTASLNLQVQLLQQQQQQQLAGLVGLGAVNLPDVDATATAAGAAAEQAVALGNQVQGRISLASAKNPMTAQLQSAGNIPLNTNIGFRSGVRPLSAGAALPQVESSTEASSASNATAGKAAGSSARSSKSRNPWYKTTLCNNWRETGSCAYGSHCQFAHGSEELLPVVRPLKYKTEFCKTYSKTGSCRYGASCNFLHGVGDLVNLAGLPVVSSICSAVARLDDGTDSPAHSRAFLSNSTCALLPAADDT